MTSKLERTTTAAMLGAALRNDETLAEIINMFGKIHLHHHNEMEPQFKRIRNEAFRKAVETILSNRRQELESRIDGIIGRVLGIGDRRRGQPEEGPSPRTISGRDNAVPAAIHRHPTRVRRSRHTSDLRALLQGLKVFALLAKLASQQISKEDEGGDEKTHVVESSGQWLEMTEKEYRSFLRRRQGLQRKETREPPLDMTQQTRLPGTTNLVPPEEDEDEFPGIKP